MEKRFKELEERVTELEQEVRRMKAAPSESNKQVRKEEGASHFTPYPPKPKKNVDWEKEIGQKWLPRVFIFVLLLGVVWAFIAGVQEGILTEGVITAIGYIAAVTLLFFGQRQLKAGRRPLGLVLDGGGVMLLILSTFAAHALYEYLSFSVAFVLNVAWIVLGFYLSHKHHTQTLAVIMSIGGFLVPFLVNIHARNLEGLFFAYEFLVYLGFFYYAYQKRYTVLHYTAFLCLHPVLMTQENGWLVAMLQHVVVISLFVLGKHIKGNHHYATVLTSFTFTYLWLLSEYTTDEVKWFVFTLVGVYLILTALNWEKGELKRNVLASLTTYTLAVFTFLTFDDKAGAVGFLLTIQGFLALYLGRKMSSHFQSTIGYFGFALGGILAFSEPLEAWLSLTLLGPLAWVILFTIMTRWFYAENYYVALSVKWLMELILVFKIAALFSMDGDGMMKAMTLSFSWLLYALGYLFIGLMKKKKAFKLFGLSMIFIILVKVTLVDLTILSISKRALLFIVLGAVGVGVSRLFYKKSS